MPRIDPYFDKQPPNAFVDELRKPIYQKKPRRFGSRPAKPGQTDVSGIYLSTPCPDVLLETAYESFSRFSKLYEIAGDRYGVRVAMIPTAKPESFTLHVFADHAELSGDREGIRRGIMFLEDEIRRADGAYLPLGTTERTANMRSRITRCFFSPINRPPKYGDELSDDIDYYPEAYLDRLMHDGANGIWIYTRFSDLVESEAFPEWGKMRDFRMDKLNRVIEKCARYGIGVYVFAIEPCFLTADQAKAQPEIAGAPLYGNYCVCIEREAGRKFVYDAGRRLMERAPGLRGFISITFGERTTSCASAKDAAFSGCPHGKCPASSLGELLADNVAVLASGMKSVNPDAEIISWTYGHRTWEFEDIRDYVRRAPECAVLMQNFDDMGYEEQLGVTRQCVDYWLSYVGPSELFEITAKEAQAANKTMYAKMQVCCSHEIASVPYVPVPGIIFDKYAGARALGVTGVLQCWYFGNYPSMMSKAAGELAFLDDFSDKDAFLRDLAGIYWDWDDVDAVVSAWSAFEDSYKNYPMNVMFSYYGPAHDSVVWQLALEPKNNKLPRTWQTLDPIDGDRMGEALLSGHTPEEALALFEIITKRWSEGLACMEALDATDDDPREQLSVARTIGILFAGTKNILEFYVLRDRLGWQDGDPREILNRMEAIVRAEIEHSRAMIVLCEADSRLGYHSEGEGYKFFPEKLRDRIAKLEALFESEFIRVRERIDAGLAPLAYYLGQTDGVKLLAGASLEECPVQKIGENAHFRAAMDGTLLTLELCSEAPVRFTLCTETRLFVPNMPISIAPDGAKAPEWGAKLYYSLFGDRLAREMDKYRVTVCGGGKLLVQMDLADFGVTSPRPIKLRLAAGSASWIPSPDPFVTLGLSGILPDEYGFVIPKSQA